MTGAKVMDQALTGSDIQVATLGTVPSATSALSANNLSGRTPFTFFMAAGSKDLATIAPFTVRARCAINAAGQDEAELQLVTSVNGASMDDNSGDEFSSFNVGDTAGLVSIERATGVADIESDEGQLVAVAPNGTTIVTENHAVGINIAGHPGQCFFAGTVSKLS